MQDDKTTVLVSRRSYRFALALCIAAISFLAFAPLTGPELPTNDKLNHIIAFFVLAWLAEGAYPGRHLAVPRWGLLIFYGLLIEVIQYHLPHRFFSLLDLVADVAGILAYSVLAHLTIRLGWATLSRVVHHEDAEAKQH